jgi:hypothetical protein
MKYAFKLHSRVMIYLPSFIKIGSVIKKLMGGGGGIAYNSRSRGQNL